MRVCLFLALLVVFCMIPSSCWQRTFWLVYSCGVLSFMSNISTLCSVQIHRSLLFSSFPFILLRLFSFHYDDRLIFLFLYSCCGLTPAGNQMPHQLLAHFPFPRHPVMGRKLREERKENTTHQLT